VSGRADAGGTCSGGVSLPALRIGPIELDVPVILAPLAGYTDLAYRTICRRLGAPYCTTEMMLDRQLLLPGKLRRRLIHTDPADHPLAGQIVGNDPRVMAAAAGELAREGFDVVDVNFACPVRKVLARRRGGYFLKSPGGAVAVLRAVCAAAETPVTVKLRIGFDTPDPPGGAFWRIAEAAFDAGAAAVCVHARAVRQRYTGRADWEFLARVKAHFAEKVVLGSGDVAGPAEAVEMIRRTGVDAAAFARAAIGNPWVFRDLADHLAGRTPRRPDLPEQRALIEEHFALALGLYGPRRTPRIMRKFGIKYARLHPTPAKVRAAFVAVKTADHWRAVLDRFYDG